MNIQLEEIVSKFKPLVIDVSDPAVSFEKIAPIENCSGTDLVFIGNKKHFKALNGTPAVAIIDAELKEELQDLPFPTLTTKNVNLLQAFIKQEYFDPDPRDNGWPKVHPSAVIHESATVPASVTVEPSAVIGPDVQIGENVVIMANATVRKASRIGDDTIIHSNVVINEASIIGKNCIIKAGAIIGSEGFGFAQDEKKRNHRIPQTGIVEIEDDCVIGANNTIERAAYARTLIKRGTCFDTLCHIAHNVEVGEDCIILAGTIVAGSTIIGNRVITSGQTGILDHLNICDDSIFVHRAGVSQDVKEPGVYATLPLTPMGDFMRNQSSFKKLHELNKRLKQLEKKLEDK